MGDSFESSDDDFESSDDTPSMEPTAATVEPTPSTEEPTVATVEPTEANEPAPAVVQTKLELSVTSDEFTANKDEYEKAFAESAGVDKSAVHMYLVDEQQRRVLIGEALQVICEVITSTSEVVEEAVVADEFVGKFNSYLPEDVLESVAEPVVITQSPTPQPTESGSDSVKGTESKSGSKALNVALIAVAVGLAVCAVGLVYMVRGRVSPKVGILKGSSLHVLPKSSLTVLYDQSEGDVETATKRGPAASVAAAMEGSWPREFYNDLHKREGATSTGPVEKAL